MNNPNAPYLDRASAAIGAAADAAKSTYHSTAAETKYNEAKRV